MRVLVTGASGFVGRSLCQALLARGHTIRAAVRRPFFSGPDVQQVIVPDIAAPFDRDALVHGVDAIVHLAAIAHRNASGHELRRVNVGAATQLAEAAMGIVRRFVLLSSVKVHGDDSGSGAYDESTPLRPADPYGRAKRDAELALTEIASRGRMELVMVRSPLVYGPGVRGNFLRLLRWVDCRMPLPLAGISNRRSLIFLNNLAEAIVRCIECPEGPGPLIFGDRESVSTPELVTRIAHALARPARLFWVPPALLRFGGAILGRGHDVRSLTGTLAVDFSKATRVLDWRPRYTLDQGLAETAKWFRAAAGQTHSIGHF